jgi:Glucoamylase and related glycosyl hydrolases
MNKKKFLVLFYLMMLIGTPDLSAKDVVLDAFEEVWGWSAITSDGVDLEIGQDEGYAGMSMRLDFDFHGGGGYVIARKALSIPVPVNYAFSFYIRAEAPVNNLEYKLIDPSNQNVWWVNRQNFEFPTQWKKITIKKRHIEFAWGPAGRSELKEVAALELSISAGTGGKGSVWIDELTFEEREPASEYTLSPLVRASTTESGYHPNAVFDQDPATRWRSGSLSEGQWVLIDFQKNREYGGLIIDWDKEDYAEAYEIEASDNGEDWQKIYSVDSSNGRRDYVYLPDTESRYLRLVLFRSSHGRGYGIDAIEVKPYQFSSSPNRLFEAMASDSPRGTYPRYLSGEQSYWTLIGVGEDEKEALMNEEGLLEVDKSSFSIEPFLHVNGELITWNEVKLSQELEEGYLPIPSVSWERAGLKLKITALAAGKAGASALYARYHVENGTDRLLQGSLFLALRPFQVTPPWQSLNMTGGAGRIREMLYEGTTVLVDKEKAVTSLTVAQRFGAAKFAEGSITSFLLKGDLPAQTSITDAFGYASGALQYGFDLPPGGTKDIYLVVPFHEAKSAGQETLSDEQARQLWTEALEATRRYWHSTLNRVEIRLPSSASKLVNTLKTTLAYILINKDGPAIQPGSRSYARSWIRDGALTSAALLGMGHTQEVQEFIKWYTNFQFASGKIPCCVDARGADPVPEHDSHGQWIYLVMEYYRYTRDVGFLTEMWPHIVKAVEYIESLRRQRMTQEYQTPEKRVFYGLLPESISHEGYASNPVHSYWDNLFTLRGLKDATNIAVILGEHDHFTRFTAMRDAFRTDLYASMSHSIALHGIDYIPGAAELGDFDASATTIAVDPGGELPRLPEPALTRTFEKYYEIFRERRDGEMEWDVYTPYELRMVGTFIRMGLTARAHELLDFFFNHQRPAVWNHWGEIVWRDRNAPQFIGDLPHTWVGSDYIRSVRSFFAFEREADKALVIGAGIRSDWATSEEGVTLKRLPTYYGTLNYSLRREGEGSLRLRMSGDVTLPPGKIVVRSPVPVPLKGVTVNGNAIETFTADEAIVSEFPADIVMHYSENLLNAEARAVISGQ